MGARRVRMKPLTNRRPVSGGPGVPPSRARRWLFRGIALAGVPLLLVGLELILRLSGYGYQPDFFLPRQINGEAFLVQNEEFSRRFFPPGASRQPGALRMAAQKPDNTVRIFVLGESAAMGDPEPAFGPARYLEALLHARYPKVQFEIVNVAYTAINSHVILPIARECARHEGDIWIVYIGNNEMVGPFGAATVFGAQAPPAQYVRFSLAFQRTRVGQLTRAIADHFKRTGPETPSWQGMQMFLETRVAPDAPTREATYKNFAANLKDIVAAGLNSGAQVMLNTVAVNLRDTPPFASVGADLLPVEARAEFTGLLTRSREAETNAAWAVAAQLSEQALALLPTFAEAHYRRASSLERLGETNAALKQYQMACDTDALPFRADARSNRIIRDIAARHGQAGLTLVEAPEELARRAGVLVSGAESFYEHVHFNFAGAYRLGLIWAETLERRLPPDRLGPPSGAWATQEACEEFLALTDWNRILVYDAMVRRLQQPPLSRQSNNETRLRQLREQIATLRADLTVAKREQARVTYRRALAARPDDHFLHEIYGNFLQLTGDLPGATAAWQRAGELMPHDFLPQFQMGTLLARQGKSDEAKRGFQRALELRPSLVEGWSELARVLAVERQWSAALDALQRARSLRPQDPNLWTVEAQLLKNLGRTAEAEAALRQATALQRNLTGVPPRNSPEPN